MNAKHPHTEQIDTEQTQPRAELWLREPSSGIHDRQQTVLAQVQSLAQNGHLDALSVHTWSKHIATATSDHPDTTATAAREKVHEFEAWADRNDHSLQPGFQRREQSSLVTDTTQEAIAPPILCLAIYEDETLREVSPCSGPDRHRTITECIESLASNDNS